VLSSIIADKLGPTEPNASAVVPPEMVIANQLVTTIVSEVNTGHWICSTDTLKEIYKLGLQYQKASKTVLLEAEGDAKPQHDP